MFEMERKDEEPDSRDKQCASTKFCRHFPSTFYARHVNRQRKQDLWLRSASMSYKHHSCTAVPKKLFLTLADVKLMLYGVFS